jgi:hypothetical protein
MPPDSRQLPAPEPATGGSWLPAFSGRPPTPGQRGGAMPGEATRDHEGYAKLPGMILLHDADLRFPRLSILKMEGFA